MPVSGTARALGHQYPEPQTSPPTTPRPNSSRTTPPKTPHQHHEIRIVSHGTRGAPSFAQSPLLPLRNPAVTLNTPPTTSHLPRIDLPPHISHHVIDPTPPRQNSSNNRRRDGNRPRHRPQLPLSRRERRCKPPRGPKIARTIPIATRRSQQHTRRHRRSREATRRSPRRRRGPRDGKSAGEDSGRAVGKIRRIREQCWNLRV